LLVYKYKGRSSLFIKLARRQLRLDPGPESYLTRPPFLENLCFIDSKGSLLEFKVSTSPEIIQFITRLGTINLIHGSSDDLIFGFPENTKLGIKFDLNTTHTHTTDSSGTIRHIQDFAYQISRGKIISRSMDSQNNRLSLELLFQTYADPSFTMHFRSGLSNGYENELGFSQHLSIAQKRWQDWFNSVPEVPEQYREKYAYAWWIMANNLISPEGYVKYEAMVPSKAKYVGIWLWDSAFHAIAYRHNDPTLARNQLLTLMEHQLPDGMFPDVVFDDGVIIYIDHPIPGPVTKPPLFAWAALRIHESEPNLDFLKFIYEPIKRNNMWWFNQVEKQIPGLVQYTHPYSSGLDDSPLWDAGMPVTSPDINTYLYIQMVSLSKIASLIDKDSDSRYWMSRANSLLNAMISGLWNEDTGTFFAIGKGKPIPSLTPFNLFPLWSGNLPQKYSRKILDLLTNKGKFWGKFGIPSVAFNDPEFDPDRMWRGPVWININYILIECLKAVNKFELAEELRTNILDLIVSQPDITEYYNPLTGVSPDQSAPTFGWSAALFIDLAIEKSLQK